MSFVYGAEQKNSDTLPPTPGILIQIKKKLQRLLRYTDASFGLKVMYALCTIES